MLWRTISCARQRWPSVDNLKYAFRKAFEGLFIDLRERNEGILNRFQMSGFQSQQVTETHQAAGVRPGSQRAGLPDR